MIESSTKVQNSLPLSQVAPTQTWENISENAHNELFLNLDCIDSASVEAAYEYCRQIIKRGSKGFYFSTLFLPQQKRRAMWAVYNFCRLTDDMVDNAQSTTHAELCARLTDWEAELRRSFEGRVRPNLPHMLAWHHTATAFKIPPTPPLELIEGVRMDLTKSRYTNFEELRLYCYRVASTVGLMASEIIGYSDPGALDYAIELGVAMQLTNILRDVGEDASIGRIYLPLDEMAEFGYTEEELLQGVVNDRFIKLMKFQIARARTCYARAIPGIEFLSRDCRLAITVAAAQYGRILDAIERNNYNVFSLRAYVPLNEKLRCLAQVWTRRRFRPKPVPLAYHELKARGEFEPIITTYTSDKL